MFIVTDGRDRALDAAIELLGTGGLRALTHGRVDQAAGLPAGSTSNHFRTRAALVEGVSDEIVRRELSSLGEPTQPRTAEDVVDLMLHRIARHDTTDPRPALRLVVRAALR